MEARGTFVTPIITHAPFPTYPLAVLLALSLTLQYIMFFQFADDYIIQVFNVQSPSTARDRTKSICYPNPPALHVHVGCLLDSVLHPRQWLRLLGLQCLRAHYRNIPIFIGLYVGYKAWKRTKAWRPEVTINQSNLERRRDGTCPEHLDDRGDRGALLTFRRGRWARRSLISCPKGLLSFSVAYFLPIASPFLFESLH